MAVISGISASNGRIKQVLGFIVEHRAGYHSELQPYGKKIIDEFQTVGFINNGHTLNKDTYEVTKLGDSYYKEVFGFFNYAVRRGKGWVGRNL